MKSPKLKILHILNLGSFGGIQSVITQLAVHQQKDPAKQVALFSVITHTNNTLHIPESLQVIEGKFISGWDLRFSRYKNAYSVFKRFDVLHFHTLNIQLLLLGKLSRKKIVFTEHGTLKKANQKNSTKNFIRKKIIGYPLLRTIPHNLIFVSEWLQKQVEVGNKNEHVIHNGIHWETQEKILPQRPQKHVFEILFVGRLVKIKRIDWCIQALKLVNMPDKFHLHIVGEGPQKNNLFELARNNLRENTFCFHGFSNNVGKLYNSVDVVVLPTKGESFGMTILEAVHHGKAVIVTVDGGGSTELVKSFHPMLCVSSVEALAQSLDYWQQNPRELMKIAQEMKYQMAEKYSIKNMVDQYDIIYGAPHE
ncbi:MAG: glycosyltransferase family 4 protein [Deferribacteres bacterium]|nr:glycosyltransferase family 4 protein [Deferribacteres bacterium]